MLLVFLFQIHQEILSQIAGKRIARGVFEDFEIRVDSAGFA